MFSILEFKAMLVQAFYLTEQRKYKEALTKIQQIKNYLRKYEVLDKTIESDLDKLHNKILTLIN